MAAILAAKSVSKQFAAVYGCAEFQLKLGATHGLHVCRRDAAAFGILPLLPYARQMTDPLAPEPDNLAHIL